MPDLYYEIMMARLAFVLAFEHAIFALKLTLAHAVGDIPDSIKTKLQREEFAALEAMDVVNMTGGRNPRSSKPHMRMSETESLGFDHSMINEGFGALEEEEDIDIEIGNTNM